MTTLGRCPAFRANSITIMIEEGSVVDDEQHFLLYLSYLLGINNFCLRRGERCRVEYMLDTVTFSVLDGTVPPVALPGRGVVSLTDLIGEFGFMCYQLTEFKIHKQQSDEILPTVLGYETELQPLFDRIKQVFQDTSNQKPRSCKPTEMSSSSKHTTSFDPHSQLQTQSDDETLSKEMAACSIDTQSSSQYSKSDLAPSPPSSDREAGGHEGPHSSRGVLVSAPSGCGKSQLLEHLRLSYTSVMFGCPVTNLSMLFELAAAKSPCLVLFDNLDTLEHNKKIQSFLDELPAGVMVVATASNPSQVPADLRQPTALGLDIVLGKPGAAARRAIIGAMMQDAELECDTNSLEDLVSCSTAATGRDLNQLVEGLALEFQGPRLTPADVASAVAAYKAAMQTAASDTPAESLVTKERTPSATPSVKVIGYQEELERLDNCFRLTLHHSDAYAKMNMSPPSRILLYGPTGCGKTWLVRAMASKYSLSLRTVTRADVFGKFFGESEKNLNDIFDKAIAAVPCILHLPSFDGLASVRSSDTHEVEHRIVNLLKARMDGALKLKGLIVVAETSRPDLLDSAIVRRGRILAYIHLGLPCLATRHLLAQNWLEGTETSDATCGELADLTEGYTVAEVKEVCREYQESGGLDMEGSVAAVQPGTTKNLLQKHARFKTTYQGGV